MRWRPAYLFAAAFVSIAMTGCGAHDSNGGKDTAFEVRDDLQRLVSFPEHPSRIVSLAPSITECVYMLGADSSLIGVTSLCDYPPQAASKPVVGDLLAPDLERILTLQPDLVLLSVEGNRRQTYDQLRRLGLNVFVTNPRNIYGIIKSVQDLGAIMNRPDTARAFGARVRRYLASLRAYHAARAVPDDSLPRVLMIIDTSPLIVAGRESYIDELISVAGGRNAAGRLPGAYPVLNRESMLATGADVILLPDDLQVTPDDLLSRFPEWSELPAVSNGRIVRVDPDLFMRPGPRVLAGLDTLVHILNPGDSLPSPL